MYRHVHYMSLAGGYRILPDILSKLIILTIMPLTPLLGIMTTAPSSER
jgi:hypothetical protein